MALDRPTVLVASRFLMSQREVWADGYELIGPDDLDAGLLRSDSTVAAHVEVIVSDGEALDSRLVEKLPRLKLVACFSTGYSGIDLALLRSRGVMLTTAGGLNAHDVADHAIALMLCWWHGVTAADRRVRSGSWRGSLAPRPSLQGKRIGVIGLGRIGLHIARRAEALGLRVGWWGPHEKPESGYARARDLISLAADSDILVVSVRATAANAGKIDREVLTALGPKGLLVNVSRGFLVDEVALLHALETGAIAGAALDVFAQEPADAQVWRRFDNVVLSPHIAGYTQEAGVAMFAQLRENIRRHFSGQPLLTPVRDSL